MRLNRYLAAAGQGSRRSCEELILSGLVTINGVTCTSLSTTVGPSDVVKVRNKVMHVARPVTLLFHKPAGYLCTASDTHSRRTIFDLLPKNFPRVFHVGRLDMESEGLLILTNDGDLALQLTHPRYKVDKEYEVVLDHAFDFALAEKMLHGISTPEGHARAASVHRLGSNKVKVVLRQGLKRQIRHMFYALGYEVTKLTRTRIGPVTIQGMPPGAWRELTQREIQSLLNARSEEAPAPKPSKPKTKPAATKRPASAPRPPKRSGPATKREEEAPAWSGEWEGDWEKEWEAFESSGGASEEREHRRPARKTADQRGSRSSHGGQGSRESRPAPRSQQRERSQRSSSQSLGRESSRHDRDRQENEARPSRAPRSTKGAPAAFKKRAPGGLKDSRPPGAGRGKPTSRSSQRGRPSR